MPETHNASMTAAARRTVSEAADDLTRGMTEELTALRAIVDAAASESGEEYFQELVRALARVVDTRWAFVAQFSAPESYTRARTIAFWDTDRIAENFEWTLAGTPCEDVVRGNLCHHSSRRPRIAKPGWTTCFAARPSF